MSSSEGNTGIDSNSSEEEDRDTSSSDDVSDASENSEDDGEQDDSTVDVTFEFFDPKENDFHGLKALLQNYLDGQEFALSELVDMTIRQSTVGTVLKSADDAGPIGVLTVFNTNRTESSECLKQIKSYIMAKCSQSLIKAEFEKAWVAPSTGLLVSERLINCPPQIAPPLQQALFDEIDWAKEDEPTQKLRDSFKFTAYIYLTRVFSDPSEDTSARSSGSKKRQKKEGLVVYARPEDEFYHKHSQQSFTFSSERPVAKNELQPMRLAMLLTADQIKAARDELDQVIGGLHH